MFVLGFLIESIGIIFKRDTCTCWYVYEVAFSLKIIFELAFLMVLSRNR